MENMLTEMMQFFSFFKKEVSLIFPSHVAEGGQKEPCRLVYLDQIGVTPGRGQGHTGQVHDSQTPNSALDIYRYEVSGYPVCPRLLGKPWSREVVCRV